jgi:hypothetical protein
MKRVQTGTNLPVSKQHTSWRTTRNTDINVDVFGSRGEWPALLSFLFTVKETVSITQWIGGWVDIKVVLNLCRRNSCPWYCPIFHLLVTLVASTSHTWHKQSCLSQDGGLRDALSLCLTKHHTKKTYLLLNQAPWHEDGVGNWRYKFTHS